MVLIPQPSGLMRRMITSWILGVLVWIVAVVAILAYLTDIYRVITSIRSADTLPGEFLRTLMTSVFYVPLFFVPALIVGAIVGFLIGILMKTLIRSGHISFVNDVRRFLRVVLGAIWILITFLAIFVVLPSIESSISSISPPAWMWSLVLIAVTTLVLLWIERRFMRWYIQRMNSMVTSSVDQLP